MKVCAILSVDEVVIFLNLRSELLVALHQI